MAESESTSEYDDRFNALTVALDHLDQYEDNKALVIDAHRQIEEDELNNDTAYRFTDLLYRAYSEASAGAEGEKQRYESRERSVEQTEEREDQEVEDNQYLIKRGSHPKIDEKSVDTAKMKDHETKKNEYRHDKDAILGALELIANTIDDPEITYDGLRKEAEQAAEN